MGIEVVERFVFRFQPILKLLARDLVVGHLGIFVVDLPAHDVGIVPEAHRHLLGDAAAEFPIVRRGSRPLRAVAMRRSTSVLFDPQDVGILLSQPGGRTGGRCADDGDDVMLGGEVNGAFQPVEIILAFGRLHTAPGKFGEADDFQVGGFHQAQVFFPAGLWPLLWIPIGAHQDGVLSRDLRGDGRGRQRGRLRESCPGEN